MHLQFPRLWAGNRLTALSSVIETVIGIRTGSENMRLACIFAINPLLSSSKVDFQGGLFGRNVLAHLEIRRGDRLLKRREVDDARAEKGYPVRLGGEKTTLHLGEIKQVGSYTLTLKADPPKDQPSPAVLMSETTLSDYGNSPGQDNFDTQQPKIPGFEVTGKLGAGGMGVVWRAVQVRTRRTVALKVTQARVFGHEKILSRFEREVELAARLEHPHIARVYDSGVHQEVHYYAMELIEGMPLDRYVFAHELNTRQVVQLICTLCTAMQYAHQRGVMHRDLKPSNILVTEDGQPHILDFGLAKDLLSDQSGQNVSLDGDVLGTPAYMSPEQAAGRLNELDIRSDIYSLGVMAYFLLTHQWPYHLEGTRYELLRTIQEQEAIRPTVANSAINKDLEAILLKILEKDPNQRYQSMNEMGDDFHNWLQGFPVKARSINAWYLLQKTIQRHRIAAVMLVLIAVIILGTGFIGIYSYAQAQAATRKLEQRQIIHQQEQAQSMALLYQTAFGLFLSQWHNNDTAAEYIHSFLSKDSREYTAVQFLLDPRPLPAKQQELSTGIMHEQVSFRHFILGECHLKAGSRVDAIKAYEACLAQEQKQDDWIYPIAQSRLAQLKQE